VPTVLTREEVRPLHTHLTGVHHLMASLLYGSGPRLMECARLRVKDVDFGYRQIAVRDGKGEKDRRTVLPAPLVEPLPRQLARAKRLYEGDLKRCPRRLSIDRKTTSPIIRVPGGFIYGPPLHQSVHKSCAITPP
jgi:integrase